MIYNHDNLTMSIMYHDNITMSIITMLIKHAMIYHVNDNTGRRAEEHQVGDSASLKAGPILRFVMYIYIYIYITYIYI